MMTKQECIEAIRSWGIKEGDVVCLQVNSLRLEPIVGGVQALIEAMQEVITDQGCLIVPTFSLSTLDPACLLMTDISYDDYGKIRDNMLGFDANITACDVRQEFANQFLKQPDVKRTKHPVYSFAFWGSYDSTWLKQNIHFPLSFTNVLHGFALNGGVNIMLGMEASDSVLLPAIAKTLHTGTITVQRGYLKKGASAVSRQFLIISLDKEKKEDLLKLCYQQSSWFAQEKVVLLRLENKDSSH